MRVMNFASNLGSGLVLLLFVPVAVLVVGIPVALFARVIIALAERF